ncbi:MAG: hypothetical protein ACAH17_01640 [Candidatus Paceibacterota bacterium]
MALTTDADRLLYILERLCRDVSSGEKKCPTPEVLTASLRTLFPDDYFPEGTGIAVKDSTNASWYVDVATEVLPPNRNDVRWLRRQLSSYVQV